VRQTVRLWVALKYIQGTHNCEGQSSRHDACGTNDDA
jgi:hypothetical protein